jgi:hypothetical protein
MSNIDERDVDKDVTRSAAMDDGDDPNDDSYSKTEETSPASL